MPAALYLADNLAMLRALLALHGTTGERSWLAGSRCHGGLHRRPLPPPGRPGYLSAAANGPWRQYRPWTKTWPWPAPPTSSATTAAPPPPRHGRNAMRYIVTPDVALARLSDPGILIAARELGSDPAHLTVVGSRGDVAAARFSGPPPTGPWF